MSKVLVSGAETAVALCHDAVGNLTMGQEERGLRYLGLAIEQMKAVIKCLKDRNDSRNTIELERLTRSIRCDAHPAFELFPEIDSSLVAASLERWSGVEGLPELPSLNVDAVPGLREQLKGAEGSMTTVTMTASQFGTLMSPKH